jgi:23S rRNA (uracil1939-C5)-methyltransferase
MKRSALADAIVAVGVAEPAEIAIHAGEPYGYRNRIRLRILRSGAALQLGYNAAAGDPMAIHTCLIAAPELWSAAQSLLAAAANQSDALQWLSAASEVELFANHDLTQLQLTLLCAPRTRLQTGSLERAFSAFQLHAPVAIAGMGAVAADPRTGPTGRVLATAGAAGLNYRVHDEIYWITRGGFFQVNRFLIAELVRLVTSGRSGSLAWDLFAGVGLFSRVLARSFTQVTAVEANPIASADNRAALERISPTHQAVTSTTLSFLERAVLERDRPGLIVLDPPRAGAGLDACALLKRIAPETIVYVSCDPTTLARDLAALAPVYTIARMHMFDLFPQTSHLESVAVLVRRS